MRVDFYHLQKQTLEQVLPKLLEKAYSTSKKIKVKVGNELRVDFINSLLWTYSEESFLPHGTQKDGFEKMQPIFISSEDDLPNNADFLFLIDGATVSLDYLQNFERVFNIFSSNNNEDLNRAREFWKKIKNLNLELHYWQQDNSGKWVEK